MVMTISYVLHMAITLFTSIPNMPTICILTHSNIYATAVLGLGPDRARTL